MYVKVDPRRTSQGTKRNFWLDEAGDGPLQGNFLNTQLLQEEKPKLLTHVRLNQDQHNIYALKNCLIDSTYLNACDPNSMRDRGMIRNAQYTLGISRPIYTNNQ